MRQTDNNIDALKGIAMMGIILVHSRIVFPNPFGILNCVVQNGARGVQLMFIINGYLIFKSLDGIFSKGMPLKNWYMRKALRILPLYWIFTILHLIVFGRGERFYLGPLSEVSWLNIACNLLCIHGFFPYYINSINVNWFIADLVIWYLIAPFVYKKFNSLQKIVSGLLIMVPVVYGLLIVLYKIPIISSEPIWKDYLFCLSFLPEFPVILLGGIIFWLEKEKRLNMIREVYIPDYFLQLRV